VSSRLAPSSSALRRERAERRPAYDLRPGAPDVAAFPRVEWLRAGQRALRSAASDAFGHSDPRGRLELRTALSSYLSRARGVDATPERIIVCSGFAQALTILAAALTAEGVAAVCVEEFGYPSHVRSLRASGLETTTVEVDRDGARVNELGAAGALLVTPAHQFPLGPTLAASRRLAAIEWARTQRGFLIEDDYDGEFRYDRQPIGAMQALAPERVVYAGTASKTLAPGLRLGWIVVPPALIDAALEARRLTDGPSAIEQLTMAEFIVEGTYDRHVRRSRLAYRRRRDRVVAALRAAVPEARVAGAAAGLHLVVDLPPGRSEADVTARALSLGLAVEGLDDYRLGERRHQPALVIGYGTPPEHAFGAALNRLCAALTAA
jgi:GntR family transcriptional regulator / MocR family aminotransferase